MYESSILFLLCIEDEESCTLIMKGPNDRYAKDISFASVGDLLSAFLNLCYYPDLVPPEQAKKLGIRAGHPDDLQWLSLMECQDLERIETLIRDIYLSDDKYVNALKPNQRFRIFLVFQQEMFASTYCEQPFSISQPILRAHGDTCKTFIDFFDELIERKEIDPNQARYRAGCRIAEAKDVYMPKLEQYWFDSPKDIIHWLLLYVIEHDKYIKKCEFCGKYFVPIRNTKKYCSDACTKTQRDLDSFCGVQEAESIYKRIVSNLRVKGRRMNEHQVPYRRADAPDTEINPWKVLNSFYSKNSEYRNNLRSAYETIRKNPTPTKEQVRIFENAKTAYVNWLQTQYEYATSLKLDRDAELQPEKHKMKAALSCEYCPQL